ncbi:MAG: protein phosphatase 2C domain-containing protein [Defluviitaleaceae bacterium]|nr:protein phosphatase 2C domain-containing protein [Defluviitaleaceae bacterium]
MIYTYGVSLPGTYHIKHDIVCQDSFMIIQLGKEISIAAVADGLGSAEHSDIGSKIAVTVTTEHCRQYIATAKKASDILDIIRAAFFAAQKAIEKEAAKQDHAIEHYDTTLTLAVLIRDTLYYGHSGDSGIIALTTQGRYEPVTKQQRDPEGRVFPLFFTDKWEFGRYSEKVSGVLMATDGMLETFFPIYIKNDPVSNIHVSLAQFFMDKKSLRIDEVGQKAVEARMKEYMEAIPDEKVNDDKTIVVLINPSIRTKRQGKEYYQEPDWAELKRKHDEAWRREAYPGLFKDAKSPADPAPTSVSMDTSTPATTEPSATQPPHKSKARKALYAVVPIFVVLAATFVWIYAATSPEEYDGNGYHTSQAAEPPPTPATQQTDEYEDYENDINPDEASEYAPEQEHIEERDDQA